jgi:hypothetical protein
MTLHGSPLAALALGLCAAAIAACSSPAESSSSADVAVDIAADTAADGAADALADSEADAAADAQADTQADTLGDSAAVAACDHPVAFDSAAKGTGKSWEKVQDFTIPTLDGDWTLSAQWTGCDSYLFIGYAPGTQYAPVQAAWNALGTAWIKGLPKHVHVFFVSYSATQAQVEADVTAQRERILEALAQLPEAEQNHWVARLHFVSVSGFDVPGWIGPALKKKGAFWWAIDALQRRRDVGMPQLPGAAKLDLGLLSYEAILFEFERLRDGSSAKSADKLVPLWQDQAIGAGWSSGGPVLEVELPPAAELATYTKLELDLTHLCGDDHSDSSCPDWDREGFLYTCSRPSAAELPEIASACQADAKLACSCELASGGTQPGSRSCVGGKAFGACECPCDTEIYRMITSYKRQGRWVTDLSPMLPLLQPGGKTRFRWYTVDNWRVTANLRFFKGETAALRPFAAVALYGTEQFNQTYNGNFAPKKVKVPAEAKGAKLVALITGHGSATDTLNCAEFCNFTNHFAIGGKEFSLAHPDAGTAKGCMNKVAEGVLPNQYGTWPYGRAGWCPGWDVKPWVVDVSAQIKPGSDLDVSYKALLGGKEFVPVPTGKGDYAPVIKMSSYLVFEK